MAKRKADLVFGGLVGGDEKKNSVLGLDDSAPRNKWPRVEANSDRDIDFTGDRSSTFPDIIIESSDGRKHHFNRVLIVASDCAGGTYIGG
jgi:hypothetical protein